MREKDPFRNYQEYFEIYSLRKAAAEKQAYLRRCARVGSIGHRGVVVTLATDPPQATLVDIVDSQHVSEDA